MVDEPWRATAEQREKMRDAMENLDDPQAFQALTVSMKEGLSGEQRNGRFLVVPKAAASRMQRIMRSPPGTLIA